MRIPQPLDFTSIMHQMKALAVYLDNDGYILEITGDSKILGFGLLQERQKFLVNFGNEATHKIKKSIELTNSSGLDSNFVLSYSLIDNQRLSFNYTVKKITEGNEVNYVLTFTKVDHTENYIKDVEGFESYEEAIKQLTISEERYNSFFDNDPVMHICVEPKTGLIIDSNPFIVKKLGYTSKHDIIGNPIYSIFSEEKKVKCLELIEKFKKIGALENEEMDLITKDGQIISVLLYSNAQRDENGEVLYSRSTLVDVTEIKNAQKILQKKRAYLELLNNQLEQFVSTCSHDLQEPLATIKFAGDVIGKLYGDKLDKKGNEYLSYIDEAVDRLSSQIRMLLEHAKIGKDAVKSEVNINSLVKTVIKDLGKRITETKTCISIPEKLPKVKGFETELRLLFQNLLSNAIKYKKPNDVPQIIIQFNKLPGYVEFLITDNGIGISKQDAGEIFKIFNKVNSTNPNKGTGIGLAHCEKIVKMHSGNIRVQSSLGSGSTFIFTIKK